MNRCPVIVAKPLVRKGQAKEAVLGRLMVFLVIAVLSPVLLAFKIGLKLRELYGH